MKREMKNFKSVKNTPSGKVYFCCDNVGAPNGHKHGRVLDYWNSSNLSKLSKPRHKKSLRDHKI